MGNEQPMVLAANENVRDLYNRLVEAVGKSGGDARGASNPTHIAFHAHPDAAQSDANPLGVVLNVANPSKVKTQNANPDTRSSRTATPSPHLAGDVGRYELLQHSSEAGG